MSRSLRQVRVGNQWLQVDDNNPIDPEFDGKNVSSDLTDLNIASPFNVVGAQDNSAIINMYSDEADDDADQWQLQANYNPNEWLLRSKASGSWATVLKVDSDGDVTIPNALILGDSSNLGFIDRGDPAAVDFAETDLTMDGAWNSLSLSTIVPAGTKSVVLGVRVKDDAVGTQISFRKSGNSNAINIGKCITQVADQEIYYEKTVPVSSQAIEYNGDAAMDEVDIVVKGWFI